MVQHFFIILRWLEKEVGLNVIIGIVFKTDKGETFEAKLYSINSKDLKVQPKPEMTEKDWEDFLKKNFAINNENTAKEIFDLISKKENFIISDIIKKNVKRNPSPPFITSTLQAEASRRSPAAELSKVV